MYNTKRKYKNKKYKNYTRKKNKNKIKLSGGNINNIQYKISWDPNIISPVFFGYPYK
jgi:hypothetical protein